MWSLRRVALLVLPALLGPASASADGPEARAAAAPLVLRGKLESRQGLTATFVCSQGTFTATVTGKHRFRITGRITGRKLRGTFETRQTRTRKSYVASGSGTLGRRSVRISGGGPNDLSRTTLVLR